MKRHSLMYKHTLFSCDVQWSPPKITFVSTENRPSYRSPSLLSSCKRETFIQRVRCNALVSPQDCKHATMFSLAKRIYNIITKKKEAREG